MMSKYSKQLSAGDAGSSGFQRFEGILRQAASNTISLLIFLPLQCQAEDWAVVWELLRESSQELQDSISQPLFSIGSKDWGLI